MSKTFSHSFGIACCTFKLVTYYRRTWRSLRNVGKTAHGIINTNNCWFIPCTDYTSATIVSTRFPSIVITHAQTHSEDHSQPRIAIEMNASENLSIVLDTHLTAFFSTQDKEILFSHTPDIQLYVYNFISYLLSKVFDSYGLSFCLYIFRV